VETSKKLPLYSCGLTREHVMLIRRLLEGAASATGVESMRQVVSLDDLMKAGERFYDGEEGSEDEAQD